MTASITTRGLTLRYGKVTAVDDVSLHLEAGRIHGLLGRNGSGKTSLLSVVAAFRPATHGEVLLDGQPVFENRDATGQICLVRGPGDSVEHDWPDNRVEDAMAFAATVRPRWDAAYADRLLERFGVPRRHRLEHLSRGQRSAVGVVLGLASRAPVTMFDESYLGMDAPARYTFYDEVLTDFMEHPRTFVVSTHLIDEVAAIFDDVVIIHEGRLLLHEDAEELRTRATTVTGPAEQVERFVAGRRVLAERSLGPTRSATVDGAIDEREHANAHAAGLELGPVALQDLFVHLTDDQE